MSFFGLFRDREKRVKLYAERDKNIIDAVKAKIKEIKQPAQRLEATTKLIEKEIKKINILIYDPTNGSKQLQLDVEFHKLNIDLDIALNLEEYFLKIYKKEYSSILIFPDTNIGDRANLVRMIQEPKSQNQNTKILLLGPHQWTNTAMSYGIDYFIIIDKFRALENLGYHGEFWATPTTHILNIWRKIIEKENFTQSETELVIEKKEFYNSVKDIFNMRASQTADISKELKFLTEKLRRFNCKNILDAGCGNGRLTEPLANIGFIMTGIDISESLLETAKSKRSTNPKYLKPRYLNMSILQTNFKTKEFDAIIMMWHVICELKQHQTDIFTDAYRMLSNRGIIIFDFPDIESSAKISRDGTYEDAGAGLLKYRGLVPEIDRILDILESKGFQIIEYHRVRWGIDKFVVVARKI